MARRTKQVASKDNAYRRRIRDGTAPLNTVTRYPSFALEKLLTKIAEDEQFKTDFKALPDIGEITFGPDDTTPMMLLGHARVLGVSEPRQELRIWLKCIQPANSLLDFDLDLVYCFTDGTPAPVKSLANKRFALPFSRLQSWSKMELRAVAMFCFLEKGHLQIIDFSDEFFQTLKQACKHLAEAEAKASSPSTVSSVTVSADEEELDSDSSTPTQPVLQDAPCEPQSSRDSMETESDADMFVARPNKRLREDDDFSEYQDFVQRIRRRVDTDNATLKAENERLQDQIGSLKADLEEMEQALEKEGTVNVQLKSENSTLRSANEEAKERLEQVGKAQTEKIEGLEGEMQELREFKQRVKGLF